MLVEKFIESKRLKYDNEKIYWAILKDFVEHFGQQLEKLDKDKLLEYIQSESFLTYTDKKGNIKNYKTSTVVRNTMIIRSFLTFWHDNKLIDNFSHLIKCKPLPKASSPNHSGEEIVKLKNYFVERYESDRRYSHLRDLVIFNLAFHSISSEKMVNLRKKDIIKDSTGLTYICLPKRTVYINEYCSSLLFQLMELVESDYIFINAKLKKRLTRVGVGDILKRACNEVGIGHVSARDLNSIGVLIAMAKGYPVGAIGSELDYSQLNYLQTRLSYLVENDKVKGYVDLFLS